MATKKKSGGKKTTAKKTTYTIFDGTRKKIALTKDQFTKFSKKYADMLKFGNDNHIIVVVSKNKSFPKDLAKFISDNQV